MPVLEVNGHWALECDTPACSAVFEGEDEERLADLRERAYSQGYGWALTQPRDKVRFDETIGQHCSDCAEDEREALANA